MTLETLQEIVTELQKRGIPATLEYPGFIATIEADSQNGFPIAWGDANETFQGDVRNVHGEVIEVLDSQIPSTSSNVREIADFIASYSKGTN